MDATRCPGSSQFAGVASWRTYVYCPRCGKRLRMVPGVDHLPPHAPKKAT